MSEKKKISVKKVRGFLGVQVKLDWNILFTLLLLSSLGSLNSCKSNKSSASHEANEPAILVNTSASTKLFIEELNSYDQELQLPDSFRSQYSIKTIEGLDYVPGVITISKMFDKQSIIDLGVKINSGFSNTINVQVPVREMNTFLTIKGIQYFEIASKVDLK